MTRRVTAILAALLAAACADLIGVRVERAALALMPEFGALAAFASNADQLQVRIERDSSGTFVPIKDTTVTIDPVSGEADARLNVVLLTNPQQFRVFLAAVRSSDGVVLFTGTQVISVGGGSSGTPQGFTIPVTYTGPTGASIEIGPRDTAIAPSASFTYRTTVRDTLGAAVAVPVTFALVAPGDSTLLRVGRLTGIATAAAGAAGEVRVVARSADGLTDTARVFIGSTPVGLRVLPGFVAVAAGATSPLTGEVFDGAGNVLNGFTVAWTSRTPAVATVSPAGVVSGVAAGTAVMVGTSQGFSDSTLVAVPTAGDVLVHLEGNGRAFRRLRPGDTLSVAIVADMQFTPSELLGSYNAQLNWNPSVLTYVGTVAGNFGSPTVNEANTSTGELRFGHANATGVGGLVTIARVRFTAGAAGSAGLQLQVTELSAAQTFTNLIARFAVAAGAVTVTP